MGTERIMGKPALPKGKINITQESSAGQVSQPAGYYSRPELGGSAASYLQDARKKRRALRKAEKSINSLQEAYKENKEELDMLQGYLENIAARCKQAPSASLAEQYNKVHSQYQALSQQTRNAYYDYLREKDVYDSAYRSYNTAYTTYQTYMKDQQGKYDAWRSTIRDHGSIQADISAIEAQIKTQKEADRAARQAEYQAAQDEKPWYEKLAGYLGGVQDTTLPTYSPAMGAGGTGEASEAMKELLAKQALLQEEYDWSQYFRYADLMDAEDFGEMSKYVSTANGQGRSGKDIMLGNYATDKSGWDDPLYEFINGNEAAGAYLANKAAAAYGADNPIGAIFGRGAESKTEVRQMTKDEVSIFNYLYATQGKEAAHAYYEYLQADLNARQRQDAEETWAKYASENPGAASVFSVATSPLKGLSYVGQASDYLLNGTIDQNAGYNKFSYINSAIRNEVAQKIEESGNWGKVGSFAYQTGMSMADFLTNTLVSGGNSALAMTIMGTGAAADVTIDAKDRGLSDGQAFALGTVAGLAEAITEKYSLEALLDATSLGKSAVGYIGKNMLAEGSEEGASSLINLFADILISKDKSQWSQSIEAYKAQGMDEGRAFGRALWDQVKAIGLDAFGGALSGGLMAAPGARIHAAVKRAEDALQTAQKQQEKAPATFQEEIQRQMTENMTGQNAAQKGTARLEDMQVEIDQATFQQGQRLAQTLGRNIVFYSHPDSSKNGFIKNGEIHVNTLGNDPMLQVFSHELTHSIEGAGSYGELSQIVLTLMESSGVDLDVARQAKKDLYARHNERLESQAAVDQELVAEYVSKYLLTDEASITSLVQNHRTLGQRIRNWFDKTLALFGNKNAQERAFLGRARDLYSKALQQTQSSFVPENADVTAPIGESAEENAQDVAPAEPAESAMEGDDEVAEGMRQVEAAYARGEIDDATYDQIMDEYDRYREEQATASERKYSISEIQGQKESYGQGVILDTDIFDGVRPRAWGDVLSAYVYNNLAGTELTVYDESGNSETIYLAKATDRVRKDGAKNSHKVLDKLARYTGDNTKALATVHLSELLETSKYEKTTDEHNHQWLDENGWELRKTYIEDQNGRIYEATLNIAKGRDRNILYAISNVKQIDKRAARGDVPSTVSGRGSLTISNSSSGSLAQSETDVKRDYSVIERMSSDKKETSASIPSTDNSQRPRYQEPGMGGAQSEVFGGSVPNAEQKVKGKKDRQYSISEETVSKKDVASELRAILKRGGSAQDLRHYVTQLERSGKNAEQKGASAEQTWSEAERIIENAKQQKIPVEEYLRQNWERYDQDGQWNADARKALEMEKKAGRKYSISNADIQKVQGIGRKSVNAFTSADIKATEQFAKQYWKEMGTKSPFFRAWFGDWRANDQTTVHIADQQGDTRGVQKNTDTGWDIQVSGKVFNETSAHKQVQNVAARKYLPYINDIVKKAVLLDSYALGEGKAKSHNSLLMHSLYAVADNGSGPELVKLYVEEMNDPNSDDTGKRAYQLQNIESQQLSAKGSGTSLAQSISTADIKSVADLFAAVKQHDANFKPNPASKITNEDGAPKVVYHGSEEKFTAFSYGHIGSSTGVGILGDGFYFSDTRQLAKMYGKEMYAAYLRIENPYHATESEQYRINTNALEQQGYDGVEMTLPGGGKIYCVFENIQIKSASDNIGTFDGSNPDIRYSISDEAEAPEAEAEAPEGKPGVRSGMPLADFIGQFVPEKAKPWRQGSIVDDETVRQAHKAGYPVIDGVQIVPFVTWVHCTDPYMNANGEVKRRSDGSIHRRNNFGIVTGLGRNGRLQVSFNNKGMKADGVAPGEQLNARKDNVEIALEYLEPVRGKYQMTKSEWDSFENSMPEDAESMNLTAEEWAEIEQLRNRAEMSEAPEADALPVKRDDLTAKASGLLAQSERKLLWNIADKLGVPKLAGREYLQPIIQKLSDEYLKEGTVSQDSKDLLFDKAYAQAVIVDAEFYNEYKHIKDHLRNTSVTISDRNKADIADFADFRKRAFGTLRIVNEGGLPVDTAYQELHSMAPDLFPESITHPADQLQRMYDVARSIHVTERTLREHYGDEEPEYRKWARNDFEVAISDVSRNLWAVRRFALDKAAKESEAAPVTETEAMQVFTDMKKARRDYERVSAKNLLTEHDQIQVGRLLRHEMELEHLDPEKDNVKGITAVYEAKKEYERLCKLVGEYKRHLRGKARKEADALLETANDWKDKKMGIAYSRETMERNIFDIIPDKKLAQRVIDKYFTPVHVAEAAATRFKNDYRDRVRAMNLSRKVAKGNLVSEAHAVQLLGEAEDNIRMLENTRGRIKNRDGKNLSEWRAVVQQLWDENPNLDKGKIEKAVKDFRYIYDALFQKMNQVRVANGYEPVNYRNGYFPHFQPGDSDSILAQFGRALGIDTRIDALPTTINGLTHTFKPGIQWFGNAQERLGFSTAYDAVEGFDKYIEGVASVIHHTANIQNLRAFASQIRYRTSDEGIRKQVDEIYERQGISDEEKQQLISEIYAHGKFTLSNFVTELDEYTNLLANKKSRYDRSVEAAMGRRAYTVLKAWEARVGANMIAGNLTSALTNFIPLTQAGAQMDRFALLHGMFSTLQAYRADDGIVGMSTFLTNRRGSDPLVKAWQQQGSGIIELIIASKAPKVLESSGYQKAKKAASTVGKPLKEAAGKTSEYAGWLMETIDGFVSGSIVRGAYYQNLKRGMSEAEAMAQADAFASSVMADRSKGAMPTLMQATNPLFKAFTQFQLEVNNQFSEVFKDIPRRFKEKGLAVLAWVLLKYFLGAVLYNELYEKLIGRRPALDPIGMLCDAYDDLQNDGFGTAGKNLAVNALEQLPFSSGLTLIGVELDGGRIPASSAVPDLTALWDAATTEGWSAEKRWKEVQDELNKLAYVVPPFGGNQISKLWKGLKAYKRGGSYTIEDVKIKDEDGNVVGVEGRDALQYPVYKDDPNDAFWNLVRVAFLGKSSLPEAQDWVGSGFNSLSAKQTAAYQDMIAAGVKDRDAYALVQEIGSVQKTATQSKAAIQIGILRKSDVSDEGKAIVYYGLVASGKEQELMDSLADLGADAGAVANALMDMRDANALKGSASTTAKYEAIRKAALTDEEKAVLVGSVMGTDLLTDTGSITQYAKFQYAIQNGMSVDDFISYRNAGASIDKFLELRDAGVSVADAMETGIALADLKNSVEDPTTVQKWRTVVDSTNDVQVQMVSLSVVMTDSQYRKVKTARDFGISPKTYVQLHEQMAKYDADGNGSFTQAEVTQAIDAMKGSAAMKAALWQLATGASSPKNNPYSTEIGQKVIDAIAVLKEKEKKPGLTFEEEILRQIMGG